MNLPAMLVDDLAAASLLSLSLTYVVHAAVWAAAACLLSSSKALSVAARHNCWKAALFAPLLSAILATAWVLAGIPLVGARAGREAQAPPGIGGTGAAGSAALWPRRFEVPLRSGTLTEPTVACLVLASGGIGVLRFGTALVLLRRRLRRRKRAADPRIVARFEQLCARLGLRGIRLTECERLSSPLVVGMREVCLPPKHLSGLDDSELNAVLAHELAHIERRDGIWFALIGAAEFVLWLQPLNRFVSARARRYAEMACDDRAVELTGSPLGLARAIVHVAEQAARRSERALAPFMACGKSELWCRVRRLTASSGEQDSGPRYKPRALAVVSVVVAVIGVALVTLSVRVVSARARLPSAPVATYRAPPVVVAESAAEYAYPARQSVCADLAAMEQERAAALQALSQQPATEREGTPESVRALELEQELRHIREMQMLIESAE